MSAFASAEELKKTTARLAAGLWSFVTKKVEAVTQQVVAATKDLMPERDSRVEHVDAASTREQSSDRFPLPWDDCPPRWHNRAAKWRRLLTDVLPQNEWTFLTGPQRVFSPDEQLHLAACGLGHATLSDVNSSFDYDREVHEGLLEGQPHLRAIRFELVPRLLSDRAFWTNYFWKVAILSSCHTDEQVAIVMSVLNAPVKSPRKTQAVLHSSHASCGGDGQPDGTVALSMQDVSSLLSRAQESAELCNEMLDEGRTNLNSDPAFRASYAAVQKFYRDLGKWIESAADSQTVSGQRDAVDDCFKQLAAVIARWEEPPVLRLADVVVAPTAATSPTPPRIGDSRPSDSESGDGHPSEAGDPNQVAAETARTPCANSGSQGDKESSNTDPVASPAAVPASPPAAAAVGTVPAATVTSPAKSGSTPGTAFAKMPWEEDDGW